MQNRKHWNSSVGPQDSTQWLRELSIGLKSIHRAKEEAGGGRREEIGRREKVFRGISARRADIQFGVLEGHAPILTRLASVLGHDVQIPMLLLWGEYPLRSCFVQERLPELSIVSSLSVSPTQFCATRFARCAWNPGEPLEASNASSHSVFISGFEAVMSLELAPLLVSFLLPATWSRPVTSRFGVIADGFYC